MQVRRHQRHRTAALHCAVACNYTGALRTVARRRPRGPCSPHPGAGRAADSGWWGVARCGGGTGGHDVGRNIVGIGRRVATAGGSAVADNNARALGSATGDGPGRPLAPRPGTAQGAALCVCDKIRVNKV